MFQIQTVYGKPAFRLIQLIVRAHQRAVVFAKLATSRIIISRTRRVRDVQAVRGAMEVIFFKWFSRALVNWELNHSMF